MVRLYGSLLGLLIEESAGVNQTLYMASYPSVWQDPHFL